MQKKNSAEIFGSFLESATIAGLVFHCFIVLMIWNFLPDPFNLTIIKDAKPVNDYSLRNDAFFLFCVSACLYAFLTWVGRYPDKLNYPSKINQAVDASAQKRLAGNFIKELKIELVWLFALISLQPVGTAIEEFGEFINLSVFLLIITISVTVIGNIVTASRTGSSS